MNAVITLNTNFEEENAMNTAIAVNNNSEEEASMNTSVAMNNNSEGENITKQKFSEFSPRGFAERMVEREKYEKLSLPVEELTDYLKKKISENGWRVTKILSILTSKREYLPEGVEPEFLTQRGDGRVFLSLVPNESEGSQEKWSHVLYVLCERDKFYKLRNFCSNSDRPLSKYYDGLISKLVEKVDPERGVIFYIDNSADVWEWNRKHYGIEEDEVFNNVNGLERAFVCGNAIHISDPNLMEPGVVHFRVMK